MPADFAVSDRVKAWAAQRGFDRLDEHLEAFRLRAKARDYRYADWDSAFMGAIRENWGRIAGGVSQQVRPSQDTDRDYMQAVLSGAAEDRYDEKGRLRK